MLEELRAASNLLDLAITRYLQACSSVQKSCIAGDARVVFPPELLTARLDDETNLLPTYKSRLQDALLAIGSAKNFSKRASASALPPEILTRIFHYVLAGGRCEGLWDYCNPEELSHVCSTWRQAAINSSSLWVHIDLSTSSRLIARTERYVARSSQLPLYVHILGAIEMDDHKEDENHTSLITSLAPRAKSIHFDQDDVDYEDKTLKTFLENCIPGVLGHIIMHLVHQSNVQFILAQDQKIPRSLFGSDTLRLDVSKQHLEGIMLGLTTFRSGGSYPLWDSKAYHNLTDLGLGGLDGISESEFVAVLSSSPRLSSLEIALEITDALPIASPVEPIHLVALERLLIRHEYSIDSLLRWIAPGPKPFHLIITCGSHPPPSLTPFLKEQLQLFFLRSDTTRVLVDLKEPFYVLAELFGAVDSIKELAIDGGYASTNLEGDFPIPDSPLRLDTLHLLKCYFDINYFLEFIEATAVKNIILRDCGIYESCSADRPHRRLTTPTLEDEYPTFCSAVKIVSTGERNPVEDW